MPGLLGFEALLFFLEPGLRFLLEALELVFP
jgi:hypothetical protein